MKLWLLARFVAVVAIPVMPTMPAFAQPVAIRIVALGASNTAGYGVAVSESYPAQLEVRLQALGFHAAVRNAGVSGDTTRGMLARLDTDVPAGTQIVVLQPGTNDALHGSAIERAANIAEIERRLSGRGIKVIVIENSMLGGLPDSEMQPDGIHYTPRGYLLLAERILPHVLATLAK
jgi:acyl-CoA thioesterase I